MPGGRAAVSAGAALGAPIHAAPEVLKAAETTTKKP